LPSGPIFDVSIELTKPVKPSTAACQRPGTRSRFIPPIMKIHSATSVATIHKAELVKERS